MKLIVAVLFVVVGLISVQETKAELQPCCTAEQFEIGFGGNSGIITHGTVTGEAEYVQGGFDFQGRQYGMEVYQEGSVNQTVKLIQFFQKNTQYVIVNSECYKGEAGGEPVRCVPDAAKYDASFYLGNSELLVDNWVLDGKLVGLIGNIDITTSRSDCTPVGYSVMGEVDDPTEKTYIIASGSFLNFTKGIQDPDRWFKVPSICNNSTVKVIDPVLLPFGHWNLFRKIIPFV